MKLKALGVVALIAGAFSILSGSSAIAADPATVAQLLATKKCVGCILINADLRNADLKGADLRGADLSFADLGGVDLNGALRYR